MTSEIEWRRRWKPDLRAQPWKPLPNIGGENFLVKANFTDNSYELLVTDTVSLWHEEVDKEHVANRTKKLNPSVEAPVSKILDHLRDSVDAAGPGNKSVSLDAAFKRLPDSDDQKILLNLNTKLAGLPFVWKFSGVPADSIMVSDHLTVPMLAMVGELTRRQQELYKLLTNKDKEIDDLKAQGVKVTRKHLETPVFDDTFFKHTMTTSKGFTQQVAGDCTEAFDTDGQDLYRDIMTKHAYLHRPERPDDEDEGTFAGDAGTADGGVAVPSWANRLPPSLNSASVSPRKSPGKSPAKSPAKTPGSDTASPTKDVELQRRRELEERLEQEEEKRQQKKKKKKLKF